MEARLQRTSGQLGLLLAGCLAFVAGIILALAVDEAMPSPANSLRISFVGKTTIMDPVMFRRDKTSGLPENAFETNPEIREGIVPAETTNDPEFSIMGVANVDNAGSMAEADVKQSSTQKKRLGMLSIDYDLTSLTDPSSSLDVRKGVFRNGVLIGDLGMRISVSGQILVNSQDLTELISKSGLNPTSALRRTLTGRDFVAVDDVRSSGLPMRYDALHDTLVIPPS